MGVPCWSDTTISQKSAFTAYMHLTNGMTACYEKKRTMWNKHIAVSYMVIPHMGWLWLVGSIKL